MATTGKGDGEKAAGLKDDPAFAIRPANLTSGQFKSGPQSPTSSGPFPRGSAAHRCHPSATRSPDADRWALAYYILSLSAFTDPITGEPLPISAADREALDDPKLETPGPEQAYGLLPP